MKNNRKPLALALLQYPSGHHVAAWRQPGTDPKANISIDHYIASARAAEAAGFDITFIADRLGIPEGPIEATRRVDEWSHGFEALSLATAIAASTERIGIVATASTTFNEPYMLARQLASIDQISGGRLGWNIVTSGLSSEATNFNPTNFHHDARYERAEEFIAVTRALWHSWDVSAFSRDKDSGVFFEAGALREPGFQGKYFRALGGLNILPSKQGHPVLVQAGASSAGRALAARHADVIFAATPTLEQAIAYRQDLHFRRKAEGRSTDDLYILPGIFPVIGNTEVEARAKFDELQALISTEVALALLGSYLGDVDLSGVDPHGPLPPLPVSNSIASRQALLLDLAARENLNVLQLARRIAGARGHWQIVGTPEQVAAEMIRWHEAGGADGFMILPPTFPEGLDLFISSVVPILRERGLLSPIDFKGTLRERLSLPFPHYDFSPNHEGQLQCEPSL